MAEHFYQDDYCTLFLGDCLDITAWTEADVLVTDPPYGMAFVSGRSRVERPIIGDEDTGVRDTMLEVWGTKPALVFGRWDVPHPEAARTCLTWDKGDWPGMGDLALPWGLSTEEIYVLGTGFEGRRSGSVIHCNRIVGGTAHPTEKPVSLLRKLIDKCPPGVIADPFAGSGSTLRAAKDMGRKAIGVEVDEVYAEIAAKRLCQEVLDFG